MGAHKKIFTKNRSSFYSYQFLKGMTKVYTTVDHNLFLAKMFSKYSHPCFDVIVIPLLGIQL